MKHTSHPRPHLLAHAATLALAAMTAAPALAVTFTWNSGTLVAGVTAPSPLAAADVLNIGAGGNKFFNAVVFTSNGTVNWNADTLYFASGGGVVNNDLWNVTSDNALTYNNGASPSFTNNGVFRKSGGVGSTTINSGVGSVNNDTLDAQTGVISIVGGSVFNAGSVFTGAGAVNVSAGTNTFNGGFTSANLVLQSGTHLGNNAAVGGALTVFSGGTLTGTWQVSAGQVFSGGAGGNKFIDGAATVVTNLGTIAWGTTDSLLLASAATVSNQGLFLASETTSVDYNNGAGPSFINTDSGTVRAAAGKTLSINNTTGFVNNAGVLDAQAGATIQYAGGSVFNSGSQFTGAGSNVAAGNHTWNGGFNSANLVLQGGTHNGNSAVVNGTARYTGGTLDGTWQVGAAQTLAVADGANKFIDGSATVVTNKGLDAVNTGDFIYMTSGATLANQGTLNFSGNGGVAYNGGALPSFVNSGLIVKSGGTGVTTIGDTLAFNNLGTVEVQTGTIALPTNFSNAGTLKGVGSYSLGGTLSNAGTVAPGASPGTLGLTGNYAQTGAGIFAVDLQSVSTHDLFNISGTAALGGKLAINCFAACSLAMGDVVTW